MFLGIKQVNGTQFHAGFLSLMKEFVGEQGEMKRLIFVVINEKWKHQHEFMPSLQ